ncbi:MAG: hypothetical protein WC402_01525 [Candidatus Pacearchaeota archaeon]|jgi:hypothetical protein
MATLEEVNLDEEVNASNFLGNSLLASVLNDSEKTELFNKVQYHKLCESQRRDYSMTIQEGIVSFFMDPKNLGNPVVLGYLDKLRNRNPNRVFVNCFCDNHLVEKVQIPQLDLGYRDHRYFMGLEQHREISENESRADFERGYIWNWAELFRDIYDIAVCPKGYNCPRAEKHLVDLLEKVYRISEEDWIEAVHGSSGLANDYY